MYSVTEMKKSVARSLRYIATKLERGSTDNEEINKVYAVNNISIIDQLSEVDLCRILLEMCRNNTCNEDKMEIHKSNR